MKAVLVLVILLAPGAAAVPFAQPGADAFGTNHVLDDGPVELDLLFVITGPWATNGSAPIVVGEHVFMLVGDDSDAGGLSLLRVNVTDLSNHAIAILPEAVPSRSCLVFVAGKLMIAGEERVIQVDPESMQLLADEPAQRPENTMEDPVNGLAQCMVARVEGSTAHVLWLLGGGNRLTEGSQWWISRYAPEEIVVTEPDPFRHDPTSRDFDRIRTPPTAMIRVEAGYAVMLSEGSHLSAAGAVAHYDDNGELVAV